MLESVTALSLSLSIVVSDRRPVDEFLGEISEDGHPLVLSPHCGDVGDMLYVKTPGQLLDVWVMKSKSEAHEHALP